MQNFLNFFKPSNLFNWRIEFSDQFILWELIFFVMLFVLAFGIKIYFRSKAQKSQTYQKLTDKIFSALVTCVITGFVLIFFQWQLIPYLSAPIIFLILITIFTIWIMIIGLYYLKNFKKFLQAEKNERDYKKYLPHTKG